MRNKYALITGASNGLGKYLAFECAARKFNLVLVALENSGLESVGQYIQNRFNVDVITIEQDLSNQESCYEVYKRVKDYNVPITVLINNAGIGGTYFFNQQQPGYYAKLIQLNVTTPTILCRLFLDDLKKNSPSYILNVSSLAGYFHLPKKQVYSGTKSFLLAFSKSLRFELKAEDVSVSVLCPGGMNTYWRLIIANRTTGTWLSRQSIMDPYDVATIAIKKMFRKKDVIIPGFLNQCFLSWSRFFPKQLKKFILEYQARSGNASESIILNHLQPQLVNL